MSAVVGALVRRLIILALISGVLACSKPDANRIVGQWHAESFRLQGLNLPIGPDLIISAHELVALDTTVPVESIVADGDEVVLQIKSGFGLSFYFENADQMYFDAPFIGKIYYKRVTPMAAEGVMISTREAPAKAVNSVANTPPDTTHKRNPAPLQFVEARTIDQVSSGTQVDLESPQAHRTPPAEVSVPTDSSQRVVHDIPPPLTPSPSSRATADDIIVLGLARKAEMKIEQNNLADAAELLTRAAAINSENALVEYDFAILSMRMAAPDKAVWHLGNAFRKGFRAVSLMEASKDLAPLRTDVRYTALLSRYK